MSELLSEFGDSETIACFGTWARLKLAEEVVGGLKAKVEEMEASAVVDKTELESLREQAVRLQAEVLVQKEHVRHLQSKLHDAKSGRMTRKIKSLESRLADAEKKVAELEADPRNDSLAALNAELQRECRKVEEERDKARQDAEYWKTCWEAAQKEHVRYTKCLNLEIDAVQSQRDRAAKELSQCQLVIRNLKQSLEGVAC